MRRACAQPSEGTKKILKREKKSQEEREKKLEESGGRKKRKNSREAAGGFQGESRLLRLKSVHPDRRGHVFQLGLIAGALSVRERKKDREREVVGFSVRFERACITAADGGCRDCSCLWRTPAVSFGRLSKYRCSLRWSSFSRYSSVPAKSRSVSYARKWTIVAKNRISDRNEPRLGSLLTRVYSRP